MLNQLDLPIGRPCPARWDQMAGDDQTRYCRSCHLTVHDLTARSASEAKAFLRANPGACVRYTYDRTTGAVLHRPGCGTARLRLARRRFGIAALVGAALVGPARALSLLHPDLPARFAVAVGWTRPPPVPADEPTVMGALEAPSVEMFEPPLLPLRPPDPPRR